MERPHGRNFTKSPNLLETRESSKPKDCPHPALKRPDNSIAFDDREKAECLADSIEHQCSENPPYDAEHVRRVEEEVRHRVSLPPKDGLDPITLDEVSKLIKGLKIRKSPDLTILAPNKLRLVEYISEGFKIKKTVAVFFDVAKAFDRVWHAGLIHKLYQLELPDRLVIIIHHYISNRHFSFRLDNTYSSVRPIRLEYLKARSPLLYSAYVNDIPRPSSGVQLALFADDTALYLRSNCLRNILPRLQRAIDELTQWLRLWRIEKTTECPVRPADDLTVEVEKLIEVNEMAMGMGRLPTHHDLEVTKPVRSQRLPVSLSSCSPHCNFT
ncbi:Probable RNA-directed DNA polymerase from transposon BS [Eumeta japonica]|uniref:Probable RNA-directed DNA polymerase from transposon BS n=1 Tax=Eumeta variegata TaxID=151549 RepID=A0A4C1ZFG3_EUMVA|nr:Probable RNA-directed DNA polymerase from transposon BS [Eumeta japonica]